MRLRGMISGGRVPEKLVEPTTLIDKKEFEAKLKTRHEKKKYIYRWIKKLFFLSKKKDRANN